MEGGVCRRRLGAAGFGLSVGLSVWLTDPQRGLASGRRHRDRRSKVQAQLHAGPRLHAGDRGHTGPGKGTLPQSPWGEAGPCVGPGGRQGRDWVRSGPPGPFAWPAAAPSGAAQVGAQPGGPRAPSAARLRPARRGRSFARARFLCKEKSEVHFFWLICNFVFPVMT